MANPKDENELVKPAVEGTLSVLKAAHKHKVQRVVITSSVAAVMFKNPENEKETYDENDWSDVEACKPYEKSKTLAEKAAWEFLNSLPDDEKFEIVTINPVIILGPSLIGGDFTSGHIIQELMSGKFPGMPKIMFGFVDVRDVAMAHLQALKVKEASNKRFLLSAKCLWFKEVAETLKSNFPDYKIKTKELPRCPVVVASMFDKGVKKILPMWGKVAYISNDRSREVLGIEYHTAEEAVV